MYEIKTIVITMVKMKQQTQSGLLLAFVSHLPRIVSINCKLIKFIHVQINSNTLTNAGQS